MQPSAYQKAVYDFVSGGAGNASVNAVAGSGKTTTAVAMVQYFEPMDSGAYMAFNTHIAAELNDRLGGVCPALTYNAFGWRALKAALGKKLRLDEFKTQNLLRYEILDNLKTKPNADWYYKNKRTICRLISLIKANDVHDPDAIIPAAELAISRYELDPPEGEWKTLLHELWKMGVQDLSRFDYDDQKYMAQHLMVDVEQFDYLVIDEYQDTCAVEANLLQRTCQSGRIIVVGDPDQCIYSFKGTTPDAMGNFARRYSARELPLSICYRCSKAVVAEAAKIVPRIEAWDKAPTGAVDEISTADFRDRVVDGDFVLCRVTVDLVSSCLKFIAHGRPAFVLGKEIGEQLISFVDEVAKNDEQDIIEYFHAMQAYVQQRVEVLTRMDRESSAALLLDKAETITVMIGEARRVGGLKKCITNLFKKSGNGICHMTVHKSKGLETNGNVYLIAPEKIPHPRSKADWMKEEEQRLLYVAITRAKQGFFRVQSED